MNVHELTREGRCFGVILATAATLALLSASHGAAQSEEGPSWFFPAEAQAIETGEAARLESARAEPGPSFREVIDAVVSMPGDRDLQSRVSELGLNVLNVLWEDTGRSSGSAYGPNISDVTLQVFEETERGRVSHLLPVIRPPNFTDRTGDIPADRLWVWTGNHSEESPRQPVPLTDVLEHMHEYLSDPESLLGDGNFLAERDTHFLVSAQHVFLPIPRSGEAEFSPVIFNYQSAPESPAVLVLLITREGMSATVIENRGGEMSRQGHGQQLYFNNAGQRTLFTAERWSDVERRVESGELRPGDETALEEGADMLMIVQVPLQHDNRGYLGGLGMEEGAITAEPSVDLDSRARGSSDVERAVLGHGEDLGPFVEMNGLELARDERFPVRVTVQFYRATSNGVVNAQDLEEVHRTIEAVYAQADYVGSLVVPEGERHRPTDWILSNPGGDTWCEDNHVICRILGAPCNFRTRGGTCLRRVE